jgi:amino acid transporter
VILVSVLSIGNPATSRTLTALAGYGYALRFLMYVHREGRPLVSLFIVLAYIDLSSSSTTIFNWLLSLGGLSALFTWASTCFAHIKFRRTWTARGHTVEKLPFSAAFGEWGSSSAPLSVVFNN